MFAQISYYCYSKHTQSNYYLESALLERNKQTKWERVQSWFCSLRNINLSLAPNYCNQDCSNTRQVSLLVKAVLARQSDGRHWDSYHTQVFFGSDSLSVSGSGNFRMGERVRNAGKFDDCAQEHRVSNERKQADTKYLHACLLRLQQPRRRGKNECWETNRFWMVQFTRFAITKCFVCVVHVCTPYTCSFSPSSSLSLNMTAKTTRSKICQLLQVMQQVCVGIMRQIWSNLGSLLLLLGFARHRWRDRSGDERESDLASNWVACRCATTRQLVLERFLIPKYLTDWCGGEFSSLIVKWKRYLRRSLFFAGSLTD